VRYDECPHEYHDELHSHEANRQLKPQMRLNFADDPIRATALRWWKESDRSDRSSSRPENRLSNIPLMFRIPAAHRNAKSLVAESGDANSGHGAHRLRPSRIFTRDAGGTAGNLDTTRS